MKQSLGSRGLHLFALCGFAFAQPLFDLLGRHAPFLVAHDLPGGGIALLVVAILAAPPALLFGLEAAAGLVSNGLSRSLHGLFVALLIAAALLPFVHRAPGITGDVAVALSVATGAFATLAYAGTPRLRRLVDFLALGPLVFAGVFVAQAPIAALLFQPRLSAPIEARVGSEAPVVIVVFDELPLTSLLVGQNELDAARYPSFHRLAQRATWYRLATTVHPDRSGAIPAILTGRYPAPGREPTVEDHPDNLLRLLAGAREMSVTEVDTAMWRAPLRTEGGVVARARALLSDVGTLYLHILLPGDLSERLPPLTHGWREFRPPPDDDTRARLQPEVSPVQRFRRALSAVSRGERPGLWYLHVDLPGRPWRFLPTGRTYEPRKVFGLENGVWSGSDWWATQAWQRHLLQLELADRLLGEFLDRLEAVGLLDEALVVVTAERGAGFWPETSRRDPAAMQHPEDVLSVPLFVKLPGQREPRTDLRNVLGVDVAPTVAAALDVELPWATDGCSLLDEACPQRDGKVFFGLAGERLELPLAAIRRPNSLNRKLRSFPPGDPLSLFRLTRFAPLVGRKVSDLSPVDDPEASIEIERDPFTLAAARADEMSLARVVGLLDGYSRRKNKAFVGVAAGGVLGAVVPAIAREDERFLFSAMLPEIARPASADDLEFFVLEGSAAEPRVWRVPFHLEQIRAVLDDG